MKPEKMTDEELERKRKDMESGMAWIPVDEVAHIDALEAERDEAEASAARIKELYIEQNNLRCDIQKERDSLRGRVQALDRHNKHLTDERDAAWHDIDTWKVRAEANRRGWGADKDALAAIRQRAESMPDTPLRQFILDVAPDACAEPSASRMPGKDDVMLARAGEQRPPLRHDGPCNHGIQCPEPTTDEAFATLAALCALAKHYGHHGKAAMGEKSLSLLERRMGAMDVATRAFIAACARAGGAKGLSLGEENALKALSSALTDAPPVFTLEEVDKALTRAGVSNVNARDVLSTLRR